MTVRRARKLAAPAERVWAVVADPHQLPRWWPRTERVEAVGKRGWTQVLTSPRGRPVRMDWRLAASEAPRRRRWAQDLAGSPFERLMSAHEVEVSLRDGEVVLEIHQELRGWSRFAPFLYRRAARRQAAEALDGLAALLA